MRRSAGLCSISLTSATPSTPQLMTSPMPTVSMLNSVTGNVAGVSEKKKLISQPTISALKTTGGTAAGRASPRTRRLRSRQVTRQASSVASVPNTTSITVEPSALARRQPSVTPTMYSAPNTGSRHSASARRTCTAP